MKNIKSFRNFILEKVENLSFDIEVEKVIKTEGILLHEVIKISPFNTPDHPKNIKLKPFHIIFGENSLSIFDVFKTDEIAGLKREDCVKKIENLKLKKKTEKEDAFIAGLTNVFEGELFIFINMERMKEEHMSERVIPHECLHLSRYLLTLFKNPKLKIDEENWWKGVDFVELKDENEETFCEILERCTAILFDRFNKTNF
jgi:hypothetical protein